MTCVALSDLLLSTRGVVKFGVINEVRVEYMTLELDLTVEDLYQLSERLNEAILIKMSSPDGLCYRGKEHQPGEDGKTCYRCNKTLVVEVKNF